MLQRPEHLPNLKHMLEFPKDSCLLNDHFDCTTSHIIYCITCTFCGKLYIGKSGHKLGNRFREHLLDVNLQTPEKFGIACVGEYISLKCKFLVSRRLHVIYCSMINTTNAKIVIDCLHYFFS